MDIGKVIADLERANRLAWNGEHCNIMDDDDAQTVAYAIVNAISALSAQKATIEPKLIELDEKTKAMLDGMDAAEALQNISDICIDWDGYRTADGLGGLVNEIWAYSKYCAARAREALEARVMTADDFENNPNVDHDGFLPAWIEYRRDGDWAEYWEGQPDEWGVFRKDRLVNENMRYWTSRPTDEQMEATPWE